MKMKQKFIRHFLISFGLLLVTAILCSFLQYQSAFDYFWFLIFLIMSVSGLFFSIAFAMYQIKLKQHFMNTAVLVGILSVYFVLLFYGFIHVKIDWAAISEGRAQLTWLQKFLKSDLSFWIAFIVPFILSFLSFKLKSKSSAH